MINYENLFYVAGLIDDNSIRESFNNAIINVATLDLPEEKTEVICCLIHKAILEELGDAT